VVISPQGRGKRKFPPFFYINEINSLLDQKNNCSESFSRESFDLNLL